jgi:hypothetical protein
LLQAILAGGLARRFARGLHGGKQQADQETDEADHNQQLDQRKAFAGSRLLNGLRHRLVFRDVHIGNIAWQTWLVVPGLTT